MKARGMKVLHLIPSMESGGAQRLLSVLLPAQAAQGVEVSLALYHLKGNLLERNLRREGVALYSLDAGNGRSLRDMIRAVSGIRRLSRGFDVVHVHLFPALYHAAIASVFSSAPYIYTEHSSGNRRRSMPFPVRCLERVVYRTYASLAAVSGDSASALAEWIGYDTGRVRRVYNGVSAAEGRYAGLRRKCCRDGEVRLLMMSRFVDAKDQDSLLRAMAAMRHREVSAVFAGDGPRLQECRHLAEELGIASRCDFPGHVDDVGRLMAEADIGVQMSHREGFGLAPVEMMAAGLPVVVSNQEGMIEAVGDAALVVPVADSMKLAEALDLLIDSEGLRNELIKKGMERSMIFSVERCAGDYIKEYRKISAYNFYE